MYTHTHEQPVLLAKTFYGILFFHLILPLHLDLTQVQEAECDLVAAWGPQLSFISGTSSCREGRENSFKALPEMALHQLMARLNYCHTAAPPFLSVHLCVRVWKRSVRERRCVADCPFEYSWMVPVPDSNWWTHRWGLIISNNLMSSRVKKRRKKPSGLLGWRGSEGHSCCYCANKIPLNVRYPLPLYKPQCNLIHFILIQ